MERLLGEHAFNLKASSAMLSAAALWTEALGFMS
jgi:hypothetical protein